MLQCLLLSTACNAIRILSSHHVFPGRLGVYHRVGELIPREDALDLERRALALPLGAWETDRHVSFPTRDVPVEVVCDDSEDAVWARRLRPALAAAYGLPEAALSLEDCFVARYDAAPDGARYRADAGAACPWVHSEPSPDPCRAVETSSGAPEGYSRPARSGPCQKLRSYFSTPALPRRCFAEDSETLVIVAASTMTDMFGATFGPYYYGEM